MAPARVEFWAWVLIYAGLGGVGLGLAVARSDGALGWAIGITGGTIAAVGALLVWMRSRMNDPP